MPARSDIKALLFDIGGVVIDIDLSRSIAAWADISVLSADQIRDRAVPDEPFVRYETGALDSTAYFAHLRRLFELEADDTAIAAGWNALLTGEIDATLALIESVNQRLPCYAFSNTSASHHACWSTRFPRVAAAFERTYLSFELGMRKPDPSAYRAVLDEIGVPAGAILFFDDTEENVAAARDFGLNAVLVTSPGDVRRAIDALAVLTR